LRRASDHRKAFRLAFGVTGISDDWYRCTMGEIVIRFRTPQSARENYGCTWEHLERPATSLGALTTSMGALKTNLGVPTSSLGTPTTSLGVPAPSLEGHLITAKKSWKHNIIFGHAAGMAGNYRYFLLFNDF
jgi:hypothetical protein